ncbi:fibroblast growth factor 17 [Trichonephila clavipes]|nr:fibroblast growth factor 17 [Trichonephila clavipes]
MSSDSDAEMDSKTPIKTITFSNALYCLEIGNKPHAAECDTAINRNIITPDITSDLLWVLLSSLELCPPLSPCLTLKISVGDALRTSFCDHDSLVVKILQFLHSYFFMYFRPPINLILVLLSLLTMMISCKDAADVQKDSAKFLMDNSITSFSLYKRRYKFFNQCSERQIEMIGDTVTALGAPDSPNSNLILQTARYKNVMGFHIIGEKNGRYLCFNKKKYYALVNIYVLNLSIKSILRYGKTKEKAVLKQTSLNSCQGQRSIATPYITVNYDLRQAWDQQMKAKSVPTDTYNGYYESISKSDTSTSGALIGVAAKYSDKNSAAYTEAV